MKKYLLRGGTLLGISAATSKILGLLRDRLLVETFEPEKLDLIFAAFRIPDFFFYLLVGATVAVIFIPRLADLKTDADRTRFFSSFLWGVLVFFGILSLAGILSAGFLVKIFAAGLPENLHPEIAHLARFLFGSVFILAISSVFSAVLQSRHRFASIAIAPIFYMGGIVAGIAIFGEKIGIQIVGFAAIFGASAHFLINFFAFFRAGGKIVLAWRSPAHAFRNFKSDFARRVGNNVAFQINQTVDVLIASFLVAGSVASFSIGSNFGHFLLSIVGFAVANSAFPRLATAKNDLPATQKIIRNSIRWIAIFTIPVAIFGVIFAEPLCQILFGLTDKNLEMTTIVFRWTIASVPFACACPLLSRVFLARDDTRTPLRITTTSLAFATALAAILSLKLLPPDNAILGLAVGNFTANVLVATRLHFKLK